jgi:hypothetical protein
MTLEFQRMEFPFFVALGLLVFSISLTSSGDRFFTVIESFFSRLAERKGRAIISVAAAAIVLRVAMLPFVSAPFPQIGDEFSYLLTADTFNHGRLANPPHPMWIYFDTFHVNQHPTYMSKYPPAQGAALAIGQLMGHPWIGVLLSVAAMVAAIVWALQAWVPASWALLGGLLALCRIGLFGYWMNSYWGGAVSALGGALVIGALGRILKTWRPVDALILGIGESLLANSRPFEGLIFSLPVFALLLFSACRRQAPARKEIFPRVLVPFAAVMLLCFLFMGYYNWRGTGNPLLLPYTLNDRTYLSASPALLWEKSMPPLHYANPQFEAFYNGYAHSGWQGGRAINFRKTYRLFARHLIDYVHYFLWPELCLPFLAIFWILRDWRFQFLQFQVSICLAGFVLVAWFGPHYAGPTVVSLFALLTAGLRRMSTWTYRRQPVGLGICRVVVIAAIVLAPVRPPAFANLNVDLSGRAAIATQLSRVPGKQLVVVHYSPRHNPNAEWVYNRASIDDAQIVWAREIPGVSLSPLLNYFRGYHVWIVDADSPSPAARPYDQRAEN